MSPTGGATSDGSKPAGGSNASGGFRAGLRRLFGDGAYEDYLRHWQERHGGEGVPLERAAFFRAEQDRRWSGIRRCC